MVKAHASSKRLDFLAARNRAGRVGFPFDSRGRNETARLSRAPRRECSMLADKDAMATVAVRDLAAAKAFYEGKLGLKKGSTDEAGVATYRSGGSTLVVYQSEFAGTNKATSATWGLGREFDAVVKTLQDAGVSFERYDMPGGECDGDVHVFGSFKGAWFKDPDGNILHINNM
jgi:catechol 2,3-dioxygenase-like lactoylglutathione lyase family enzyme